MTATRQQEIFEQWLEEYKGILFKIVRVYGHDTDQQDDLFQEVVIQVWRSVPKFRDESAAATWVYRVALNTAIKWTTRERKIEEQKQSEDLKEHMLSEKETFKDERVTWLYEEINKLDEIDRSLALLLLDGFSYKEMADMIGISSSNIGVRIHRIKKHLITQSEKYQHHGI